MKPILRKTFAIKFWHLYSLWLVAGILTGCQSAAPPLAGQGAGAGAVGEQSTRDNCYSLLHQLLADEKNVDLLRFIKREESDVKKLVKRIAARSAAGSKLLEDQAELDPAIRINDISLPPGEVATRKAIASTQKKRLLGQSGDQFELSLLLSQAQALGYASHLAKVAAETDSRPERVRALNELRADLDNLYQELFDLLLSRMK